MVLFSALLDGFCASREAVELWPVVVCPLIERSVSEPVVEAVLSRSVVVDEPRCAVVEDWPVALEELMLRSDGVSLVLEDDELEFPLDVPDEAIVPVEPIEAEPGMAHVASTSVPE